MWLGFINHNYITKLSTTYANTFGLYQIEVKAFELNIFFSQVKNHY